MSLISLTEFQKLVHLSDEALLWLLKSNRLPCSIAPDGSIVVNSSGAEMKALVQAISKSRSDTIANLDTLILEKCARLVSGHVEEFAEVALRSVLEEQSIASRTSLSGERGSSTPTNGDTSADGRED